MKNLILNFFFCILLLLYGCNDNKTKLLSTSSNKLRSIKDIEDKRIGVLQGSIHDSYATKNYPKAEVLQYQNATDLLIALKSAKIDAVFFDHIPLKDILSKNQEIGFLAENVYSVPIAAIFNLENDKLRGKFNSFLQEIKSNGVYNEMLNRWMVKGISVMPDLKSTPANDQLKVGVVSDSGLPFTIVKDGELVGFEIELCQRFANYIGKKFVPVELPFGSLIASVASNKIDLAAASVMVTEERKKQIDFSEPYFESGVSLIARKDNIEKPAPGKLAKADDIFDKKVGVFTGTVHDAFVARKYPKAQIFRYESLADMMLSVRSGKIDVAMFDLVTAKLILKRNPELGILSDDILTMPVAVGFNKNNPILRNDFNQFLETIKQNGTYATIYKRWFIDDPEKAIMPAFRNNLSGMKITAGVSVDDLPYVAYMKGEYSGFDIELIKTFAEQGKYNLEIIQMEFPSLIAALAAGKVDLVTDGIAISEERAKQIDFADPHAEFKTAVVALKSNLAIYDGKKVEAPKISFWQSISNSFYNNIILEDRYLLIIDGLKVTIIISILSAVFGTLIGSLICFLRMSKKKILSASAKVYISFLRGTPVLVLLMIIYYIVFASVNINPVIVAVFAFGLNFGAYVSEMFRTSIESIDKGQMEAGIAGGFTKIQTFVYIILPQALRHVLPVYKGEFISLVKMTSIVGYIAVQDLTKAGDIIRSRTFDAFFPLIMAAVLYLIIAWLLTWILSYIEISVDPKHKRIKGYVEVS